MAHFESEISRSQRWNLELLLETNLELVKENMAILGKVISFHPEKISAEPLTPELHTKIGRLAPHLEHLKELLEEIEVHYTPDAIAAIKPHQRLGVYGKLLHVRQALSEVSHLQAAVKHHVKAPPEKAFSLVNEVLKAEDSLLESSVRLLNENVEFVHEINLYEQHKVNRKDLTLHLKHMVTHATDDLENVKKLLIGLDITNHHHDMVSEWLKDWQHYHHLIHMLEKYRDLLNRLKDNMEKLELEQDEQLKNKQQQALQLSEALLQSLQLEQNEKATHKLSNRFSPLHRLHPKAPQ